MATVALAPLPPGGDGIARATVLLDGVATGTVVDGAVLEAALELAGGFLLFATDDVPFEESLHVHYLAGDGARRDEVRFAQPYATGSLRDLARAGARSVRFRFLGEGVAEVEVLARPQPMLPLWGKPLGAWRGWRARGWLVVKEAA